MKFILPKSPYRRLKFSSSENQPQIILLWIEIQLWQKSAHIQPELFIWLNKKVQVQRTSPKHGQCTIFVWRKFNFSPQFSTFSMFNVQCSMFNVQQQEVISTSTTSCHLHHAFCQHWCRSKWVLTTRLALFWPLVCFLMLLLSYLMTNLLYKFTRTLYSTSHLLPLRSRAFQNAMLRHIRWAEI
jgi:hypothetical protein